MDKMTGATIIGVKLIATLHNGAKLVEGLKGSSLHLNGVNQWASLGIHEQSCLGNLRLCAEGFSVAFWVKYETVPRDGNYRVIYFLSSGGQAHANGIAVCYVDNGAEGVLRFMAKLASQNQMVQMWRADVQCGRSDISSQQVESPCDDLEERPPHVRVCGWGAQSSGSVSLCRHPDGQLRARARTVK